MAGGFLSGLVIGAVVSGAALSAVSVATGTGTARPSAPVAAALEVPAGSEFNQSLNDTAARLPQADGVPGFSAEAPQVGAAAPDDLAAVAGENTQPSDRPQPGGVDADLSAPQIVDESSGMAEGGMDGAAPEVDTQTAMTDSSAGTTISADPAQPSLPDVESGAGMSTNAVSARAPEATESSGMPEADSAAPTAPADEMQEPDQAVLGRTNGDVVDKIETGRLPSIGAEEPADTPDTTQEGLPQLDLNISSDSAPAIVAHAESFANSEGKPLMAIILIDDGSSPIRLDALDAFPYPLTFAVDAAKPGAQEAMERYRDAGFEVLAIANLPEGADARDTETVMQTVFAAVPEAVGVLEGTGTGLQISRDASEQLAPILLETGHGLVVFSKGLETAPKLIAREGVPVGTVFRDFDSEGQSATVIRRFLDQAAFKAGRDAGGVIMLGRLRADTISALLLWGLQDRANRVALAPISAVLTAEK
ncbi:divergent polysaccharide deacteylase family protein [Roseovarius arcticus]|uniref:divergent polysaccharide deacteylase family protein n=1 Tax=Roseovarius arcticus TaxID=2547404 RepID=UPI001FE590CA|nr:divergent polysaccharide deacetylase family protein [Roseovarius arcticus]